MVTTPYELRLLGPPELLDASGNALDFPLGKPFGVLAYLALAASPPSRQDLAMLFWGGSDRKHGRMSVRQALWRIRRALDCALGGDPDELPDGLIATDVERFEHALAAGRLTDATRIRRGPLLERFALAGAPAWERWADRKRTDLDRRFASALSSEGRRLREEGGGDDAAAITFLETAAEVQPSWPEHHIALIEALLARHRLAAAEIALANARPRIDGKENRMRLRTVAERLRTLRRSAPESDGESPVSRTEFVGRTEEFGRLTALWRAAERGETGAALLTGPPDVGKTRLADELALFVRSGGGAVASVEPLELERPIEWALVSELVRRLLGMPGARGVAPAANTLLHALLPSQAEQPPDGSPPPPAALSDALSDLIAAVAWKAPLLLIIDDLQWADPTSRAVLSGIACRLEDEPCLFVFACRENRDPSLVKTLSVLRRAGNACAMEFGAPTDSSLTGPAT